ncbi:hypothetical protein LINPERHAP2_LOCUS35282 [Linum perenne]
MFMTNKAINFNAMQNKLASIWRPAKGVTVEELGNKLILFQFYHEIDLHWVIDNGPWSFDNAPLAMHKMKMGERPETMPLNGAEFWIQVHQLPAKYCTEVVGKVLGNYVGEYMGFDDKLMYTRETPYMRIRVRMDVTIDDTRFDVIISLI